MRVVLFALLLVSQWAAAQEAPPALRLPDAVRPLRYDVRLTLEPEESVFRGVIEINVTVRRPTAVVWLNARFLEIERAEIEGVPAQVLPGGTEFVGLRPAVPLASGRTVIRIEYRGELSARDNVGAFRVREGNDWYVYTQFESIFARRAFPCFDEPGIKVPWQLTLDVPIGSTALSNTPVFSETPLEETGKLSGMKRVRFGETRPLPSYLIAFAVGPFDIVDAGKAGRNATPVRIITPRGQGALARYAVQVTPRLLEMTEDYTGIPHPYEKLDSIVVPRPGGAMENPGLITYASNLILAQPRDETPRFKQAYAHVAAHEIAHLWFGDLVTHAWWDDVWLNESFATWLSVKTIERFAPGWDIRAQDAHGRDYAMKNDALASARRIRQPIESTNDIFNAFDPITYAKGGAVLGMFENWIGEARFAQALRQYLSKHADGNADAPAFLAALEQAQRGAAAAFDTFLEQAGLPLLSVELMCEPAGAVLRLTQQRYAPLGSRLGQAGSESQVWQVPFCARSGGDGVQQRTCTLMTGKVEQLALGSACPVFIAVESSRYYRIAYRGAARSAAPAAATSVAAKVADIGDLEALARSGALPLGDMLEELQPHAASMNRDIVQSLLWAFGNLRPLVTDDLRVNWERWLDKLFSKHLEALGLAARPQDSDDTLRLRPAIVGFLAAEGNEPSLHAELHGLAMRQLAQRDAVDGTMIEAVLAGAARHADRDLFERLVAALPVARDRRERRALYSALGAFDNPTLARRALALLLDPAHDHREAVQIAWTMSDTPEGAVLAFEFMKTNFDALVARAPRDAAAAYPRWASAFCSEAGHAEVEDFFRARAPRYAGGPRNLAQTLERIRLCTAFKKRQQESFAAFLKRQ